MFEAADFALHPCRVATVTKMSEVGSGDDAKRSDFGQGLELGVAKKVSPLPRIVRAWGIEGFRDPADCLSRDLRLGDRSQG